MSAAAKTSSGARLFGFGPLGPRPDREDQLMSAATISTSLSLLGSLSAGLRVEVTETS